MSTDLLVRNPTSIGDIFFSGSQSVKRGDYVQFILSDNWAFKATENCRVSMDGTPFVNITIGQTFLIKQGSKYVFDIDTVIALAYPQEVTQDLIVQNDIYNNNLNEITIEADKTPVAKIVMTQTQMVIGDTMTISGSSSYSPDNPPQDLTYKWIINGVQVSTAVQFSFKASQTGIFDLLLIVTDEDERKGSASKTFNVVEAVVVPDLIFSNSRAINVTNLADNLYLHRRLVTVNASSSQSGSNTITASVPLATRLGNTRTVYLYLYKNDVQIASKTVYPTNTTQYPYDISVTRSDGVSNGDEFELALAILGDGDDVKSIGTCQIQTKTVN